MTKILPFWEYTKNIFPFPSDISNMYEEIIHAYQLNMIKTIKECFWSVFALDSVNKLHYIDIKWVEKLISDKREGFKFRERQNKQFNLKTLFYALGTLKIINKFSNYSDKIIDGFANSVLSFETNNGFVHCFDNSCPECGGKPNYEATFYGLASLYILDRFDKIDKEKYIRFFGTKIARKGQEFIYYLLCLLLLNKRDLLEEEYFTIIDEFEDNSGGYKFKGQYPSIYDTFLVVSLFSGLNWSKGVSNLGRIFEFIRNRYENRNSILSFQQMDLIDYCQSILILSIIYDELTERIKIEILKQLYEKEKVFYEELKNILFVKEDLIDLVVKNLEKERWFKGTRINNETIYQEFIRNLSRPKQFLAEEIIKRIKRDGKLDLTEYANKIKSGAVIELTRSMLDKKIIIGKIEVIGKFLRKAHYIFKGYMPEKGIKREGPCNSIPFFKVVEEKERFPIDKKEILDILKNLTNIPESLYNKIFNLIDCDKVELAKIQLKNDYNESLKLFNKINEEIQNKLNKYKYLNQKYIKELENIRIETLKITRMELERIKDDLINEIQRKETSLNAIKDLDDFREFVEQNLVNIKNKMDELNQFFQNSIENKLLDKNSEEILKQVNNINDIIEKLTPNIQTQVEILNKIVEKTNLIDDYKVSGFKFEPLHTWLYNEFLNKRNKTSRTLSEIRSKIFKRDELKRIITNKTEEFNKLILESEKSINKYIEDKKFNTAASILKDKTKELLKYIENTNNYILGFVRDTSKLIDGFDNVVDDIIDKWLNDIIIQMQNHVKNLKFDLEKTIISKKELDARDKFDEEIQSYMNNIKEQLNNFESSIKEIIQTNSNINEIIRELNTKYNELNKLLSICDQNYNQILKKRINEFDNFKDTANVQIFKWTSFKNNIKNKFKSIYDNLLNKIIIKIIIQHQDQFPSGRVPLNLIKNYLNLKSSDLKNRINTILNLSNIEGKYYPDKDEITIFTPERKKILNYINKVEKIISSLNEKSNNLNNFYIKSCKKKQIESITPELLKEIKELYDKSNEYSNIIKNESEYLNKNIIDIKITIEKWDKFKDNLQNKLTELSDTIRKRIKLKELINDAISTFKNILKEIQKSVEHQIEKGNYDYAKELLNNKIYDFKTKLNEINLSIQNNVQQVKIKYYKYSVSDLLDYWKESQLKLLEQIDIISDNLLETIKKKILEIKKNELEKLIENKLKDISEIRNKMENLIYPQISIDVSIAQKKLYSISNKFNETIKESTKEINNFIKDILVNISRDFKSTADLLLNKYNDNLNYIKDLFEQTYQMLEDEMIIKIIKDLKSAYESQGVELGLIANMLNISRSHLKNRLIQLISDEKIDGVLYPETNQFLFTSYSENGRESTSSPRIIIKHDSLFRRFINVIKKWQIIIAFIAAMFPIINTIWAFTNNLVLTITIPISILLSAIIWVIIQTVKEKRKKSKI